MTRLLIRSGKDPFTPVAAETTLTQDVFNSNSGNFLFQHSVWKALSTDDAELVSNSTLSERNRPARGDAERINDEFDHFVIPLANAFRPEFASRLDRLSELIEQLTIPVTVTGIGAQAAHGQGIESLGAVAESTQRFVSAVLDRSASIGVRGEFTRNYLRSLGFADDSIDIIGCPSLFIHGPDFQVERRVEQVTADSPLALNLTPEVPGIGAFATAQAARHRNLTYIGQDAHDLRLLLWGTPFPHVHDPAVPVHMDHPLYTSDRMWLFLDQWTWFDFMSTQHFAYGTRFHGNVAALLGGTPAMLLAHDSRTLELAEYHRIPHILQPSFGDDDIDASRLYEQTDLTDFNQSMASNFARYTAFLERNGLNHRWADGAGSGDFDQRLAAARFPAPVRPVTSAGGHEIVSRLKWLRDGMVLDITRHPQAYEPPFAHPAWTGAGSRHARIQAETAAKLKAQSEQIDDLRRRLVRIERRSPWGLARLAARRAKAKRGAS